MHTTAPLTTDPQATGPQPPSPGGPPSSGGRARRRWVVVGSIVGVLFVGWVLVEAVGLVAREERTVRRTYSAAELRSLLVETDTGDVRVVADSEERVVVAIRIEESLRGASLSAGVEGGRLRLRSSCPEFGTTFCSVDYVVHVPRRLAVTASSDNGDVDVRGVDAVVAATSDNGDVVATDVAGRRGVFTSSNGDVRLDRMRTAVIRATSENGDVAVDTAVAPRSVVARSDNGDVRVDVPRGEELYAADARSDNGEARTRVRTDPSSDRPITATSDNGDVAIAYR